MSRCCSHGRRAHSKRGASPHAARRAAGRCARGCIRIRTPVRDREQVARRCPRRQLAAPVARALAHGGSHGCAEWTLPISSPSRRSAPSSLAGASVSAAPARARTAARRRAAADAAKDGAAAAARGAGARRAGRAARRADLPRGARHRRRLQARSRCARRSTAGSTRCCFNEGQAVKQRRAAGADRSAPVPGRSCTRPRARWPATARSCDDSKLNLERYTTLREEQPDRAAAGRRPGGAGRPVRGHGRRSTRPPIESAKLNLDYARITLAASTASTGMRLVDPGNLVHADRRRPASWWSRSSIRSRCSSRCRRTICRAWRRQLARGDAAGRGLEPRRRAAARRRASSRVIDNQINQATATMRLKAIFPNPTARCGPTSSSRRGCSSTTRKDALVVPAAAVQRGPAGHVRLRRRRRQTGADAARRGRAHHRRPRGDRRAGSPPASRWSSTARTSCGRAPRSRTRPAAGGSGKAAPAPRRGAGRAEGRAAPDGSRAVNISEPFIRRPVATTLLMIGVALAGHRRLPRSCRSRRCRRSTTRPSSSRRSLPGASAETMASAVTTPLERQFGQMPSLDADDLGVELRQLADHAAVHARPQHRRRRAGRAGGDQRGVEPAAAHAAGAADLLARATPPTRRSSRSRSAPTRCRSAEVDDYADSILAQKISQVSGVGLVTLNGGQKPAVRVQVDPVALAGAGPDARGRAHASLVAANVNQPKGNLDGPRQDYTLADQRSARQGRRRSGRWCIAYKNGAPMRLADVAHGRRRRRERAARRLGRRRSAPIILNVQRQPGANVIAGRRRVKALLAAAARVAAAGHRRRRSSATAPRRCAPRSTTCSSRWCSPSCLVVAVIYLFLRSLRATIIPGVAVPLSLIAHLRRDVPAAATASTTCR